MKTKNIVPITYLSGTGGNFISWFVNNANHNIQHTIELSKHGNAHKNPFQYHGTNNRLSIQDHIKINETLEQSLIRFPDTIWYPGLHVGYLKNALNIFNKIIRISLHHSDFKTVNAIMVGKIKIDNGELTENEINDENFIDKRLHDYWEFWVDNFREESYENVLYIKFSELLYGDTSFVQQISEFTSIPLKNFNFNNLEIWREKTLFGIKHVESYKQLSEGYTI